MGYIITWCKCTKYLTAHRLKTLWTGARLFPHPFLLLILRFLILANLVRDGSVFTCSTAYSSAAEMSESKKNGTDP